MKSALPDSQVGRGHRGVTNDDNLISLARDKHLLKSMGLYVIDGDPNGEITLTSPMGIVHHSTPCDPAAPVDPDLADELAQIVDDKPGLRRMGPPPGAMTEWLDTPEDPDTCPF